MSFKYIYSYEIVENWQEAFNFLREHTLVRCRKLRFLRKFVASDNIICMLCSESAEMELNIINRTQSTGQLTQYRKPKVFGTPKMERDSAVNIGWSFGVHVDIVCVCLLPIASALPST